MKKYGSFQGNVSSKYREKPPIAFMQKYQQKKNIENLNQNFKKYCYFLKDDLVHRGGQAEEEVVEAGVGVSGMVGPGRLLARVRLHAELGLHAAARRTWLFINQSIDPIDQQTSESISHQSTYKSIIRRILKCLSIIQVNES